MKNFNLNLYLKFWATVLQRKCLPEKCILILLTGIRTTWWFFIEIELECVCVKMTEFLDSYNQMTLLKQGGAQGGVLSSLFFKQCVSEMPDQPAGVNHVSYADDCAISATGRRFD